MMTMLKLGLGLGLTAVSSTASADLVAANLYRCSGSGLRVDFMAVSRTGTPSLTVSGDPTLTKPKVTHTAAGNQITAEVVGTFDVTITYSLIVADVNVERGHNESAPGLLIKSIEGSITGPEAGPVQGNTFTQLTCVAEAAVL